MVIYALRLMALRRYKFHVVGVGVLIQWFKSFFPVCWLPADHFFAPIPQSVLDDGRLQQVVILTVPHAMFVARLLKRSLGQLGVQAEIIHQRPERGFQNCLHFVIAAQAFRHLPRYYVAYQMEQCVSNVLNRKKYQRKLRRSVGLFDYSLMNIEVLKRLGFPESGLWYMPVRPLIERASMPDESRLNDVIFYGASNNLRRQQYLRELQRCTPLKVIDGVFGERLLDELSQAKIVVNIHYYEGALLETTRIYECLSRGTLVVSESSADIDEHSELSAIVDFVPVGDVDQMVRRVQYWIENDCERQAHLQKQEQLLLQSEHSFTQQLKQALRHYHLI